MVICHNGCDEPLTYPQVIHRLLPYTGRLTMVEAVTWLITACILSGLAITAAAVALVFARRASATSAKAYGYAYSLEKSERLTPSTRAELAEFKEAIARAEELLAKVNRREIARAKPRNEAGEFEGATSIKDALRRKAGIVAGQPARHA